MSFGRVITLLIGVGLGITRTAQAGIVVAQSPYPTGGLGADTDFLVFGLPFWERSADDFVLLEPASIRRVTFWGFYGSTFDDMPEPPPDEETMRLRFYKGHLSLGFPDESNIVREETFLNPLREPTGRIIETGPAPPEYKFEIDLNNSLHLTPLTEYWIELTQIGAQGSLFRWEFGLGGNNDFVFRNPNVPDWVPANLGIDLAFELSTLLEPSTGALMIIGTVVAGIRRSRREVG